VLAGLVLAALVVAAAAAGRWGRPAALPLAVISCLWLLVNSPMEGRVLLEVTDTRGLTAADLAGLAGLLLALLAFVRPPRR
jgi:hypothetical protein